jgi:hypothetical protein
MWSTVAGPAHAAEDVLDDLELVLPPCGAGGHQPADVRMGQEGTMPDDHAVVVGPQARTVDHAREQLPRACALPVPARFVRVVQELTAPGGPAGDR